MTGLAPDFYVALKSISVALLIGLLVGFQREASGGSERHAGVRDFILIALTGGVCGLLQISWLTVATLVSMAGLLAVFHVHAGERTGITTEMAAIATFALGFLAAMPAPPWAPRLAIATTIVVVAFLEAKRALHKLIHETITETEFNDTLWFLAIIFIIYPVLPEGHFGPYDFFSPRRVWLFVILISSISFIGYFLQRFMGREKGLQLTAVLGGLASTTATTAAFARNCATTGSLDSYWAATVTANTVHFPRILAILYIVKPELARFSLPPLAAMTAAGALFALVLARRQKSGGDDSKLPLGNPFRLKPALKLGAVFTAILFLTKATMARIGASAVYATSVLGGSVDVDAVALSVADLQLGTARAAVLLALAANAVFKTGLAAGYGSVAFGVRVACGFLTMFVAGGLALFLNLKL